MVGPLNHKGKHLDFHKLTNILFDENCWDHCVVKIYKKKNVSRQETE